MEIMAPASNHKNCNTKTQRTQVSVSVNESLTFFHLSSFLDFVSFVFSFQTLDFGYNSKGFCSFIQSLFISRFYLFMLKSISCKCYINIDFICFI